MSATKKLVATRRDPPVLVRFPKEILRKVEAATLQSGRSRNTEILFRVEKGLQVDADPQSAATAD